MSEMFSDRLKAAREAAGLSRVQLAARAGINPAIIERWENGRVIPSDERQRSILAVCRKPRNEIAFLVAELQDEMAARLEKLAGDLETIIAARKPTPAAESEVRALRPAAKKRRAK